MTSSVSLQAAPPQFVSSRCDAPVVSFEQALLKGLAPDGGLYLPDQIPSLPKTWREEDTFSHLATTVLKRWITAPKDPVLAPLTRSALNFPVPLVPLDGDGFEGIHVLELFHGPTLSFKDFGARMMARLMNHFMQQRRAPLTILVATSGDTGSAVASGFAGQDNVSVVLLYPKGQVSPVQERQLIAQRSGVRTYAVEGTFDDCQRLVKEAFVDDTLSDMPLSSANSINIGRLLPQMLYYIWAARQLDDETVFCVPSGNLGNLTGGVLAALSGLPVRRFIAAHNANDFFPRFLDGEKSEFDTSKRTLSNAMDVGAPSNFERLNSLLADDDLSRWIWGTSVTDAETLQSIRRVHDATGYVADPHTAVGLEAARRYRQTTGEKTPITVLSTAHPAKFPQTVERALDLTPTRPKRLAALWDEPTRAESLPSDLEALRAALLNDK